jgi:hypothetical protein
VSKEIGLSFACLGFLNGLETVLTVRAEHALALDCQLCLSIFQLEGVLKKNDFFSAVQFWSKLGQNDIYIYLRLFPKYG